MLIAGGADQYRNKQGQTAADLADIGD